MRQVQEAVLNLKLLHIYHPAAWLQLECIDSTFSRQYTINSSVEFLVYEVQNFSLMSPKNMESQQSLSSQAVMKTVGHARTWKIPMGCN